MKGTTMSRILLGILCISMSACATKGSSLRNVTKDETDKFIEEFYTVSDTQKKEWNDYVASALHQNKIANSKWVQPSNTREGCRIFFAATSGGKELWWEKPGTRIYWDGECRNGYAYGTGREFVETEDGLSSSLATYDGTNTSPRYYMDTFYDQQAVVFKVTTDSYHSTLRYRIEQKPFGQQVVVEANLLNAKEQRLYNKISAYGKDLSHTAIVIPNGNNFGRINDVNPANFGVEWNTYDPSRKFIGFSVGNYKNHLGEKVRHLKATEEGSLEDVRLPESYLKTLYVINADIDRFENTHNQSLQEAFVAVNKYKRRICKGEVSVDYIDDEIYGRICLVDGELSAFKDIIDRGLEEQEARHKKALAQLNAQRARNQQIASQAAAEQSRDVAAFMDQLNSTARSFRQSAEQIQQSTNAYQAPEVNFGQTGQNTITCVRISNIVSCRD